MIRNRKTQNVLTTLVKRKYFEKIDDNKYKCLLCSGIYSSNGSSNLTKHLRRVHYAAYLENCESRERNKLLQNKIRNIRIDDIKTNSLSCTSAKELSIENYVKPTSWAGSSATKVNPFHLEDGSKFSLKAKGKLKKKMRIEKLAEEKLCVANLKKQLLDKEVEEHKLKILLLQKEIQHKEDMSKLEKEEIEYRKEEMEYNKQINELIQQEMLLKISILRGKELKNCKTKEISMPIIE